MSQRDWGIDDPEDTFWYNTKTGQVESGKQSLSIHRAGPFATAEEAARAPDIIAERSRQWAEEDAAEEDE